MMSVSGMELGSYLSYAVRYVNRGQKAIDS